MNFTSGLNVSGSGSASLGTGSLTVNNASSGMSGTTLSAANLYVGSGGTGTFTHSAGTVTVSNGFYLGYNSADTGTYALSGTGKLSLYNEFVGYSVAGSVTQSGGSNGASLLVLGYNSTGNGAYNLSAGTLSVTSQSVGFSGAGSFTQSGGSNANSALPGLQLRRQRNLQPDRWHAFQHVPVRGRLRHGDLRPIRRNQHHRQRYFVSRSWLRDQRHLLA